MPTFHCLFFFFQAEDGIRDHCVTGVQTCALPIYPLYEREGVRLNPATREASVDGRDVVLSGREWAVLETLLARPGSTLSRQQIEDKLYGWGDEVSSNAIEVYIHGLRKKLGAGLILNVRGVGYMVPKP